MFYTWGYCQINATLSYPELTYLSCRLTAFFRHSQPADHIVTTARKSSNYKRHCKRCLFSVQKVSFRRAIRALLQCVSCPFTLHLYPTLPTSRIDRSAGAPHLAAYPLHYHGHDVALLRLRKSAPRRYAVPFGQASAAATARGVLRYEHRMAAHGRLPSVIRRHGWRKSAAHKVAGVAAYYVHALGVDILYIFRFQAETAAEGRPRQPLKQVAEVVLRRFANAFSTAKILIGEQVAFNNAPFPVFLSRFLHLTVSSMQSKTFLAKRQSNRAKMDRRGIRNTKNIQTFAEYENI